MVTKKTERGKAGDLELWALRDKDPGLEGLRGIRTSVKHLLTPRKKDYTPVKINQARQNLIDWAQAKQKEGKFTVGTNEVAEFIARAYVIHNAAIAQKAGKKYEYSQELEKALNALAKLRADNYDLTKFSPKEAAIEMHKRISCEATGYAGMQRSPLPIVARKFFRFGNCHAITMAHLMMARHPFKVETYARHAHLVTEDYGQRYSPYMGTRSDYNSGDMYDDPAALLLESYKRNQLMNSSLDPFNFPASDKHYAGREAYQDSNKIRPSKKAKFNLAKTAACGALLGAIIYGASLVKLPKIPITNYEHPAEVEISTSAQEVTVKKATDALEQAKQVLNGKLQSNNGNNQGHSVEVARLARLKEAQNALHWSMAPTYTSGKNPSEDRRILAQQGEMSRKLQVEIDAERTGVVKKVDNAIRRKMQSNPGYPNGLFNSLSAVDLQAAKGLVFDHLRELSNNTREIPNNLYHFRLFQNIATRATPDEVIALGDELNPLVRALTFNEYVKMSSYLPDATFSGPLAAYKHARTFAQGEDVSSVLKINDPYLKFATLNQIAKYVPSNSQVPENKLKLYTRIVDEMQIASRSFTENEKKLATKFIADHLLLLLPKDR